MSQVIPLAVSPGTQINQQLQNPGTIIAIKLTNGTPFDLTIWGFGSKGQMIVPAGLEYMLHADVESSGTLSIMPVNNNNITGTGVVNLNIFYQGESLPSGQWPVTVPTQIVQAKVSTVTNLVNDGSSVGTQIIESTPAGASGSTISILNDGTVVIKGDVGGVLTTLLQLLPGAAAGASSVKLGDAARAVEALGNMIIDGTLTVTGEEIESADIKTNTIKSGADSSTMIDMSAGSSEIKFPGQIDPNKASSTTNGTSGSVSGVAPLWGTGLKIFVISLGGYQNTASVTFIFPSAIGRSIIIGMWNSSTLNGMQVQSGATVENINAAGSLTTTAESADTTSTTIHNHTLAHVNISIDRIIVQATTGVTDGFCFIVGL